MKLRSKSTKRKTTNGKTDGRAPAKRIRLELDSSKEAQVGDLTSETKQEQAPEPLAATPNSKDQTTQVQVATLSIDSNNNPKYASNGKCKSRKRVIEPYRIVCTACDKQFARPAWAKRHLIKCQAPVPGQHRIVVFKTPEEASQFHHRLINCKDAAERATLVQQLSDKDEGAPATQNVSRDPASATAQPNQPQPDLECAHCQVRQGKVEQLQKRVGVLEQFIVGMMDINNNNPNPCSSILVH